MMIRFLYSRDVGIQSTYGQRQIAARLHGHLMERFGDVEFVDLADDEYDVSKLGDDDLVVGHPGAALHRTREARGDRGTLVVVPIPPWNEMRVLTQSWRHILFIGGRQWFEDLCEAHRNELPGFDALSWHPMCVDLSLFRRVKQRFNPPGQRRFLYVGRFDQARKNILRLIEAFAGLNDSLTIVAPTLLPEAGTPDELAARDAVKAGRYPNIRLQPFTLNTAPEFIDVVRQSDVYIHPASFDSQATSILESIAYGLVPVVTRESGFEYSFGGFLNVNDIDACHRHIRDVQQAPGAVLEGAACAARERLGSDHTWAGLCGAVDRAIDHLMREAPSHPCIR